MDYLNPCNKNQTAKILERFFYVSNGREYISVIQDEAERITKLAYYEIKCYEMEKNNIVSKNEWLKMN